MKIIEGKVLRINGKTAIVEVVRRTPHPIYKKLLKRSKKYKVDVNEEIKIGETVKIVETRPLSKDKNFKILIDKKGKK